MRGRGDEDDFVIIDREATIQSPNPDIPTTFSAFSNKTNRNNQNEDMMSRRHEVDDVSTELVERSTTSRRITASRANYDPSADLGMLSPKPILFLCLWYFFSGLTLFFNKYIVAIRGGSEAILSSAQLTCTLIGGYVQLTYPCGMGDVSPKRKHLPQNFNKNMMIVGALRFSTVLLGMFALDYLEVSFTETIKSTAPAFTVVISRVLLRKHTLSGFFNTSPGFSLAS